MPATIPSSPPARSLETVVELRNVSQQYFGLFGAFLGSALTDASFEVKRGQIFGLVGPSRSGKSTATKLLAGQLKPFLGKVKVLGRSPRRRYVKSRLAWLPQVGSGSTLSPAVAMAYATAKRAQLVILDEPFTRMDPRDARELTTLIRNHVAQGGTVFLTSQSLVEVKDLCHRIALIYNGRIEAIGTVAELLSGPRALRSLAPVLSASTSEQLLKSLRNELETTSGLIALAPNTAPAVGDTNVAPPLKGSTIPDPVNHVLLAQLGRHRSGASSCPPE